MRLSRKKHVEDETKKQQDIYRFSTFRVPETLKSNFFFFLTSILQLSSALETKEEPKNKIFTIHRHLLRQPLLIEHVNVDKWIKYKTYTHSSSTSSSDTSRL
jgi:hypothetical protein